MDEHIFAQELNEGEELLAWAEGRRGVGLRSYLQRTFMIRLTGANPWRLDYFVLGLTSHERLLIVPLTLTLAENLYGTGLTGQKLSIPLKDIEDAEFATSKGLFGAT